MQTRNDNVNSRFGSRPRTANTTAAAATMVVRKLQRAYFLGLSLLNWEENDSYVYLQSKIAAANR